MGCIDDCAIGVVRLILFLFNFLIFICAILLITLGATIQYNNVGYDLSTITIFAIVIGSFIGLISFLGCCGAWKGNSCLLTSYAGVLITLFIVQIVLGVVIFVQIQKSNDTSEDLNQELKNHLKDLYKKYVNNNNYDAKVIIDDLQQRYECCGIDGPTDQEVRFNNGSIIPSCCKSFTSDKPGKCYSASAYQDGCLSLLYDFLEKLSAAAGGIAIGFGVLELVAAIFAFCVRNHYNDKRHATY